MENRHPQIAWENYILPNGEEIVIKKVIMICDKEGNYKTLPEKEWKQYIRELEIVEEKKDMEEWYTGMHGRNRLFREIQRTAPRKADTILVAGLMDDINEGWE